MKKGHSKNRHFSKGTNKNRRRTFNRRSSKQRKSQSTNAQLAERSFKWNRIGTIIQIADFLIDKAPLLFRRLLDFLGMG